VQKSSFACDSQWAVVSQYHRGGKEIRAEPFAAAWQGGNVYAVAGAWIADFLEEAEPWPAGKTKDQIGCGLESCPF